ncbi:MAG: phosphomannomutase/phosphoglucomutase [Phycisphaerales bacterium]|nr:phosphomannomutase/phosphoglucomutase [Phycisphaerales bacterium]
MSDALHAQIDAVFKAYDIRAITPDPLSADVVRAIGHGAGTFLKDESAEDLPNIVVGRDMRLTSPDLAEALIDGLLAAGVRVADVGLCDTPMVPWATKHLRAAGGIQVTASHNPPQYNGLKICRAVGRPVGEGTGLETIRLHAKRGDAQPGTADGATRVALDLWDDYRRHVHAFLPPGLLDGSKQIELAIDGSNGMAGTCVPKLFGDVPGLTLHAINMDNATGHFAHPPNPLLPEVIAVVGELVRETGAAAGMCFDGDADRCMIVDEHGEAVGCDLVTAWLAPRFLADNPGAAIAYDLRSSKAVHEAVTAAGGVPVRSRVGHVFMKKAMADNGGVFGGELSGHFYFRDNGNCDSGAMAFACLASALVDLADAGSTFSAAVAPLKAGRSQSGEINFEVDDKQAAMDRLVAAYPDADTDTLDGVTVDCGDWWCNVRASNTEPLLRLNLEACDADRVAKLVAEVSPLLGNRVEGH